MSAASEICGYLAIHTEATKPQICRDLHLDIDTVTTAMRKLLQMGCVTDTGRMRREGGPRRAKVFALGDVPFEQGAFTAFFGGRTGRPHKAPQPAPMSFEAMAMFFRPVKEAA